MNKLSKLKLTAGERKAIAEFSQRVKKTLGKQLLAIKLFGSKARGDFDGNSDIDIFILVHKQTRTVLKKVAKTTSDIWWDYHILLSPVLYDLEEYNTNMKMNSFFFEEVKKEGLTI